jgi:hypothetical protein
VRKIFGREVAAAVCCGKEEGAFSAKLLRGRPGRGFQSIALDATVRKTPVAPPTTHDLHAALLRQLRGRHVPTTSTSSHGPLTAQLTRAVGGPNSFWGPWPFAPSRGRIAGRAPGGYCRCSGYRGIPVHHLLGPIIGPSSAEGRINDPSYGEDPHEEAPREENDDQNC